jgi:hypothetical protein
MMPDRWQTVALAGCRHSQQILGAASVTKVCGATNPPVYANCAAMHRVFPHGIGEAGAVDHTTGTRITTFYVSNWVYSGNTARDAGKDGIAWEQA